MATRTQTPPVACESPSDLSTVSESVAVESSTSGARIVDEKEVPHVVTEKLDEAWQVSSIPEPKQYFCLDVRFPTICT